MDFTAIVRALKSNTDRAIGNDLKQGVDREFGNIRQNAALGIQQMKRKKTIYVECGRVYKHNGSIKKILTKKKTFVKPQVKNADLKSKIEDLNIEIEDLKIKIEIQDLKTKIKKFREHLKQRRF